MTQQSKRAVRGGWRTPQLGRLHQGPLHRGCADRNGGGTDGGDIDTRIAERVVNDCAE